MKLSTPVSARLRFCQRRMDNRLIAYTFGPKPSAFVTPFFQSSTLKQRILMLQKSETNRWAMAKYGFVVLLTLSLFVFVAACEDQSKKDVISKGPVTISGQIFGSNDKPIPGANIELKGLQRGTSTDANGEYQFSTVPANGTLIVSFVGHETIEVPVNGQEAIYVRLAQPTDHERSTYWVSNAKIPKRSTNTDVRDLLNRKPVDDGNGEIFTVVEKNPEFPGGMAGLTRFINENLRYPEAAQRAYVSGRVFLSFVINTDGSFQNIQILKGIGFGADEEAIRVIKAMPRWKPATQDGKPVRVKYNLPINFNLKNS
ncbi:TonB family protein [Larkinella sp. C7]|jgi:TonB family protein|uniref:TonB family protein n=1 Tax=Larkinella sp. C7 TaxID=2576607 RepID=UPI001111119D|nr:TonB family protein [Larkinella sp. C7]